MNVEYVSLILLGINEFMGIDGGDHGLITLGNEITIEKDCKNQMLKIKCIVLPEEESTVKDKKETEESSVNISIHGSNKLIRN